METENKESRGPKAPSLLGIEKFLSLHYDFRYNIVSGKLQFKKKNKPEYKELTDFEFNSIHRRLQLNKLTIPHSGLRSLLMSDYVERFDPFKHYLDSLPQWDGQTDYIEQLASTVKTTNDILWQTCFKKWIVAMVGSLLADDVVNHTAIIFSGGQGIGKTTWVLNLVPKQLSEYVFSGTINPDSKDSMIQISECCLINLDELENLNRSELGSVKEIITKSKIRIRRPYGMNQETLVRRASFAGSVNGKQFLSDTTGTRRFLCFEVLEINYQHKIDLDLVYSQAVDLFNSDFKYWFERQEIDQINRNNEQYQVSSLEEELLLKWFSPCSKEQATHIFTNSELVQFLTVKQGLKSHLSSKLLGMVLNKHKFLRLKDNALYKYALKVNDEEKQKEIMEGMGLADFLGSR